MNLETSEYNPRLKVVRLGYTLATMQEFQLFIRDNLVKKYTRDSYDVVLRNCNNFTDDALRFLIGAGVPDQVLRLQEFCRSSQLIRLMRPALNKWLGGFKATEEELQEETPLCNSRSPAKGSSDVSDPLILGDMVVLPVTREGDCGDNGSGGVLVATVTREGTKSLDLKCFDPSRSEFVTRIVDRHSVSRHSDTHSVIPSAIPTCHHSVIPSHSRQLYPTLLDKSRGRMEDGIRSSDGVTRVNGERLTNRAQMLQKSTDLGHMTV